MKKFNPKQLNIKRILPIIRGILLAVVVAAGVIGTLLLVTNLIVINKVRKNIIDEAAAADVKADCILVLGCSVRADGTPSRMLSERVEKAVELYFEGAAPKLLMSGDHGKVNYNEVGAMKELAISLGVPSEDIFEDHAGFSTYESMYRAKAIFGAEKIIVVTHNYHLFRAIYIAEGFGMTAKGVACAYNYDIFAQLRRDLREVVARTKDFFSVIFKPEPTYLGEKISLKGDGNVTEG